MRILFAVIFLCCSLGLSFAQTPQIIRGEEVDNGPAGGAIQPLGEANNEVYYLYTGMAKKLALHSIRVYDKTDITSLKREIKLKDVLSALKNHEVSYAFFQHDRIYLVTLSKDAYFGSVIGADGNVIKSNVPLFKAGVSIRLFDYAEVIESADKKTLALVYRRSTKGKQKDEFNLTLFDGEFGAEESHAIKLPVENDNNMVHSFFLSSNKRFYISLYKTNQGTAYWYDLANKTVTAYELPTQEENDSYGNGRFHESKNGSVYLFMMHDGGNGVNGYALYEQKKGASIIDQVDMYTFSEEVLKELGFTMFFTARGKGIHPDTEVNMLLEGNDGTLYPILECYRIHVKEVTNQTTKNIEKEYEMYWGGLICITLNKSGKVGELAIIAKSQGASIYQGLIDRHTLGRFNPQYEAVAKARTTLQLYSYAAYTDGNKVFIIFNDHEKNGIDNDDKGKKLEATGKSNLVIVTVSGAELEKQILKLADETEFFILPQSVQYLRDGTSLLLSGTSKKFKSSIPVILNK